MSERRRFLKGLSQAITFSTVAGFALHNSTAEVKGAKATVLEKNKAVVREFEEEFKNKANIDIVDKLFAPNFVHHLKDPRLPAGREGMKMLGKSVFGAFSNVRVTVEDMVAERDRVVTRITAHATHTGEFNRVPATNKAVTWTEIHIYRLEKGKIAEHWGEIDFLSLLTQIGAIPAPGA